MPLTFEVDGKVLHNPTSEDIEAGFASIDADGPRSVSMVKISREPVSLIAFGHPKEGYSLEIETVLPKAPVRRSMTLNLQIPQEDVLQTFKAFARNDESWPTKFEWRELEGPIPTRVIQRRMIFIMAVFVVSYLVLKYVLKIF